jgi:peptidyl-prolyl cis-trans isomerase SurA
MKRLSLVLLALSFVVLTGAEVVDRIAAVVNEEVILLSEVDEKLFILQAQGQLKGIDSTEVLRFRREVLDRLIEEKLVVQRAQSLGIEADPQEIRVRVDEALQNVRNRFASLEAFRQAIRDEGITENMLRERYESDIRQEILGQRIVGREVRSKVQITTDDVRKYYDESRDEIPTRPVEVHLAHLVAYPLDPEREREARRSMALVRQRIEAGEEFSKVAEEVSDDPSRSRGGLLGWFSPGDLDPDFEAALDTLQVGELSQPVRSRYGYHLIEVLDRDGVRFQVRHILTLLEPGAADVERAREKAERALARIRDGEGFEDVAREVSEDALTREGGGDLGWTPTQYLLPEVASRLDTLNVGDVSPVVESDRGFHVFKILNRRSGGEYEFEEIKDRLRAFLEQKELERVYDEWLAAVRDSAYVEIKTWER